MATPTLSGMNVFLAVRTLFQRASPRSHLVCFWAMHEEYRTFRVFRR